ncbi:MAG: pseudouridine synthase [Hungatella sp.]|nr:pseudouridine synthase [Hungatella sp.]
MEEIRLNKYLSEMGICSRREADRLIEAGKIQVDGKTAYMGMKIRRSQTVICGGTEVETAKGRPSPVLLAVNKPKGIVCTTSDKDRAVNIVEMVKYPERVYPVGRLDKDSEGLIFLTNQGSLVNQIMKGSSNHEKEYVVQVNKAITEAFVKIMEEGVWLEELGVATKPCKIAVTGRQEFHIILTQGLNRQIRRMCTAQGYHVTNLRRIRIMNIHLGNLKTGTYRKVTAKEYETLIKMLENNQ